MQSVTDTDRDAYEERVGIMEYDGGLSQAEAEQEALRLILRGKLCAIPDNCELRTDGITCNNHYSTIQTSQREGEWHWYW